MNCEDIAKVIHTIPRGVEQEYALVAHPPLDEVFLNRMIDKAISKLRENGYISNVEWSLDDETGNIGYERARAMAWTLPGSPTEQAYNGMRIYNDAGHFEVATPLYADPIEAVVYERVSEFFAYLASDLIKDEYREAYAYKTNISTRRKGETYESVCWGTHGNITVSRGICNLERWEEVKKSLVPYIVTRILITGAGGIIAGNRDGSFNMPTYGMLKGDTVRFVISPRAFFLTRISSLDTGEDRGILNERDEPHADELKYWRLHDINLEGIRSDFQVFIRDVLQALVLIAFNRGYLVNPPQLANPLNDIRTLSSDCEECNWRVTLSNGKRVSAVEEILEGYYLAKVEEVLNKEGASNIDWKLFSALEWLIEKLQERRLEALVHGIDWITKLEMIKEYGVANEEEGITVCNQYALIDGSAKFYLERIGSLDEFDSLFDPSLSLSFLRTVVPSEDFETEKLRSKVQYALIYPPSTTRECLRTLLLRKFPTAVKKVSWSRVYFNKKKLIEMKEPLMYTENEVKEVEKFSSVNELLEWLAHQKN